jgi:nucleotide-binding universal stress UspA family protein
MNVPFAHIACCVEFESATSTEILAAARALRAIGPGTLSIVHVVQQPMVYPGMPGMGLSSWAYEPADVDAAARKWLDELVGPGEQAVILNGYPPASVCEWAPGAGVDLIVIAVTRRMVERVFLGSFASYMAHNAPCPVLMVRPIAQPDPDAGGSASQ